MNVKLWEPDPEQQQSDQKEHRRSSNNASIIPNVLIAGAQKSGTTSISHYLHNEHNACFSIPTSWSQGEGKESHFFDIPWLRKRGIDYYRELFAHCHQNNRPSLIVDGTPEFMKHPRRIRQVYEEQGTEDLLKIIFALREPVSREISWYHHRVRECATEAYAASVCDQDGNPKSFADVMRSKGEVIDKLQRNNLRNMYGTYAVYLKVWFEVFDRHQILVLSYDEAKSDPLSFMGRIHRFLNLPGEPQPMPHENASNNTGNAQKGGGPPDCDIQQEMYGLFEPLNEELYKVLEAYPGPDMEQQPFPKFTNPCVNAERSSPLNKSLDNERSTEIATELGAS